MEAQRRALGTRLTTGRRQHLLGRNTCAAFFIGAGVLHFVVPQVYVKLIPPGFPNPKALVAISGVAEVAGGAGLLVPRLRKPAGWGLLALLAAVYPANIYMAVRPDKFDLPAWVSWLRLPFQFLFAWWVWTAAGLGRGALSHSGAVATNESDPK